MSAGPGCFAGHPGLRLREASPAELTEGTGRVHVWLHAAGAAGHDFHAGAGSFAAVVDVLARARAQRRVVAVSSLLTRSNARVLGALPGFLAEQGAAAWRVVVPRTVGAFVRAPGGVQVAGVGLLDGLVPRLSVALPHALRALAQARGLGLAVGIAGAPLCLLGPFAGISMAGEGAFAAGCGACPARARCPGVDPRYLARFAGDELSPRGLRPAEGEAPAMELFAGTGVLEQVGEDMSQGAGHARRHLPIVGGGLAG